MPGRWRSAVYLARPVTLSSASMRGTERPIWWTPLVLPLVVGRASVATMNSSLLSESVARALVARMGGSGGGQAPALQPHGWHAYLAPGAMPPVASACWGPIMAGLPVLWKR